MIELSFGRAFENWLRTYLAGGAYRRSFSNLELRGDERVLELGCGGGHPARVLLDRLGPDAIYTGLDVDEWWVARARKALKRYPNAEVLLGDVRDLPLEDGSYDLAVAHFVVHELTRADREPIFHALATKLRPDGRLFAKEPTGEKHGMPADELLALAEGAGLSEVRRTEDHTRWLGNLVEAEFEK